VPAEDLGEFRRRVASSSSWGPAYRWVPIHIVHVTDSDREHHCSCCGVLPSGSELWLWNGEALCRTSHELQFPALQPARGYQPAMHWGGQRPRRIYRGRMYGWR
jgi:hypothetical protein